MKKGGGGLPICFGTSGIGTSVDGDEMPMIDCTGGESRARILGLRDVAEGEWCIETEVIIVIAGGGELGEVYVGCDG